MAFNNGAVAAQLKTLLEGLSGMGVVQIGAPEGVGPRISGYVTLGSQNISHKTAGTTQRQTRFYCMLAYRVDGAETTAETTLMSLADAFMAALYADLTLAGTCTSLEASSNLADEPEYAVRAGKEYREYPIVVVTTQQGTYEVNP